ncbi:MAG: hypothetical protein GXP63_00730 [DPANN group archaeon]|nr:hypothetical protein [DPANN group archaeon]
MNKSARTAVNIILLLGILFLFYLSQHAETAEGIGGVDICEIPYDCSPVSDGRCPQDYSTGTCSPDDIDCCRVPDCWFTNTDQCDGKGTAHAAQCCDGSSNITDCAPGSTNCNYDGQTSGSTCYYNEICSSSAEYSVQSCHIYSTGEQLTGPNRCVNQTTGCSGSGCTNHLEDCQNPDRGTASCTDSGATLGSTCYYNEVCSSSSGYKAPDTCHLYSTGDVQDRSSQGQPDNCADSDSGCASTGCNNHLVSCQQGSDRCTDDGYATGTTCYYDESCSPSSGYSSPTTCTLLSTGTIVNNDQCADSDSSCGTSGCSDNLVSCSSGSSICTDDGYANSHVCYWNEDCSSSSGYILPLTYSSCVSSGCTTGSGGQVSGELCYYNEQCTGTGYYSDSDDGPDSIAWSSCEGGYSATDTNAYCYDDSSDTCYHKESDACTGSGWQLSSSACYDRGDIIGGTQCANNEGSCSASGCTNSLASCSAGTSSCSDDALEIGNSCFYGESCTASSGYIPPTEDTSKPSTGYSSGDTCYYGCNIQCTSSGWQRNGCSFDTNKMCGSSTCTTTGWDNSPCQCSAYVEPGSCDAQSSCEWCNDCDGNKYSGDVNRCVNAGTCSSLYQCQEPQCGAECNGNDFSSSGGTCSWGCDSASTCSYQNSASCASGSSSCFDDPAEVGNVCYYGESCSTSGYTPPSDDGPRPADYYGQGSSCFYGCTTQCTTAGWQQSSCTEDTDQGCAQATCTASGWDNSACSGTCPGLGSSECQADSQCNYCTTAQCSGAQYTTPQEWCIDGTESCTANYQCTEGQCGATCDSPADYDATGGSCSSNCDAANACSYTQVDDCAADGSSSSCYDNGFENGNTCYYGEGCDATGYTPASVDTAKPTTYYASGNDCLFSCDVTCTATGWDRNNCVADSNKACASASCTTSGWDNSACPCSVYGTDTTSCNADSSCEYCTASTCSGNKYQTAIDGCYDTGSCPNDYQCAEGQCGAVCDTTTNVDASGGYCRNSCDTADTCQWEDASDCTADGTSSSCFDDGYLSGSDCLINEDCQATGYTPATRIACDSYDDTTGPTISESEPTASTCSSSCSGQDCCQVDTKTCDTLTSDNFYVTNNGCGGSFSIEGTPYYCIYDGGHQVSTTQSSVAENTQARCQDGYDNDCDGNADCTDPDCSSFCGEICTNEIDDNANNLVDCQDTASCGDGATCAGSGNCCNSACDAPPPANSFYDDTCRSGPSCDTADGWSYQTANEGAACSECYVCNSGYCAQVDLTPCNDPVCQEPTCDGNCGLENVPSGQTDESCFGSTGCSGSDCQCDGNGNCIDPSNPCAPHGDELTCENDSLCDWCQNCEVSGNRQSATPNSCVLAGNCYSCVAGNCGATCDTPGGFDVIAGSPADTCSWSCDDTTSCSYTQTASCSQGSGDCFDDGYEDTVNDVCYFGESCDATGYHAPSSQDASVKPCPTATCTSTGWDASSCPVCTSYTNSYSCGTDTNCEWCEQCDANHKYSGDVSSCVNAGSCAAATCSTPACGASCDQASDFDDTGGVCQSNCDGGICEYLGTVSCSQGTASCHDDGVEVANICYTGEDCTAAGYTPPTANASRPRAYHDEGNACYYGCNVQCTSAGWTESGCSTDFSKQCGSSVCTSSGWDNQDCACSVYSSSSTCEGDNQCDWCQACSNNRYSGGLNRCVAAGNCNYQCVAGECLAECDSSLSYIENGGSCLANCDPTCQFATNESCAAGTSSCYDNGAIVGVDSCYYGESCSQTGLSPASESTPRPETFYESGQDCWYSCDVSCTTTGWSQQNCVRDTTAKQCSASICTNMGWDNGACSNGCDSYGDAGTCGADNNCEWCTSCDVNNSYSQGPDRCTAKGTCSSLYQCTDQSCGATCENPSDWKVEGTSCVSSCDAGNNCQYQNSVDCSAQGSPSCFDNPYAEGDNCYFGESCSSSGYVAGSVDTDRKCDAAICTTSGWDNTLCPECMAFQDEPSCGASTGCDWCPTCEGGLYSTGTTFCVLQGTCNQQCTSGECGQTCLTENDFTATGGVCNAGCDASSEAASCTYQQTTSCATGTDSCFDDGYNNGMDGACYYGESCSAGGYVNATIDYNQNCAQSVCTASGWDNTPCCYLDSVSISPNCGPDGCRKGDTVSINAVYHGNCPATAYVQVDAASAKCAITHNNNEMSGIYGTCSAPGNCQAWTVPDISSDCLGETADATYAGLYKDGYPGDAGAEALYFTTPTGSVMFWPGCGDGELFNGSDCVKPAPGCNYDSVCDAGETCACDDCFTSCGTCNYDSTCDANENCECSDCFSSSSCGLCNNDAVCDPGENCECSDCYGKQDTCAAGHLCDADTEKCELIGCPEGTTLCPGNVCKTPPCGEPLCDNDNSCEPGENCECSDCYGWHDSCDVGLICDPDGAGNCTYPRCPADTYLCPDGVCRANCNPEPECNNNSKCDWFLGETCNCADCFNQTDHCDTGEICLSDTGLCGYEGCPDGTHLCDDGQCLAVCTNETSCDNDGTCNTGESCLCADCYGEPDTCLDGLICDPAGGGQCTNTTLCDIGLTLCDDGSCKETCDSHFLCDYNGTCDPGEGCECSDCLDNTDSCVGSSVCGQPGEEVCLYKRYKECEVIPDDVWFANHDDEWEDIKNDPAAEPHTDTESNQSDQWETECDNGLDDDNDGAKDMQDPDCYGKHREGQEQEICNNQQDDDGDHLIDNDDPDCYMHEDSGPPDDGASPEVCDDCYTHDGETVNISATEWDDSYDNGQFYACQTNTSDIAYCTRPDDCVDQGVCYIQGYHGNADDDSITEYCDAWNETVENCFNGIDDDGDLLIDADDPDCDGYFTGYVFDSMGTPIAGAKVEFIGYRTTDTYTDGTGWYGSFAKSKITYDLVASSTDYTPKTVFDQYLESLATVNVNFTLAVSGSVCQSDCTLGGICEPSCDGQFGCYYYNEQARDECEGRLPGFTIPYNSTHVITCCGESGPYITAPGIRARINVDAKNVVTTRKVVLLNGEVVNMVVMVFDT